VGPGVEAGRRIDGYDILDLAPTIMNRLGAPMAELQGQPIPLA
jgi:hypothetical protein